MNNRIFNINNPNQGTRTKTLCCCSAGLLRSPTAAFVLARDFNRNTRAVGLEPSFALIPPDMVILEWADEIVVMTEDHLRTVRMLMDEWGVEDKPIYVLDVLDMYEAFDPQLMEIISKSFERKTKEGD